MNQKIKKIPLRKCVITGLQHPKMEMFRVVRTPEQAVVVDLTGKVRGHGVYLTKSEEVINKAMKKHLLDRFLEVKVEDEIYLQMLELLKNEQ